MVGIKPKEKVKREWSANFAYAIGLLVTDGSLSIDGRHIELTSKDIEQLKNFFTCLGLNNKIGQKMSGYKKEKYLRVQFGDTIFYRFLLDVGLTPAKSKTIGVLKIPRKYFFDFLRGCFDGDGSFYSYYDPRWKSSFMFYATLCSASITYIRWIQNTLFKISNIKGHITSGGGNTY